MIGRDAVCNAALRDSLPAVITPSARSTAPVAAPSRRSSRSAATLELPLRPLASTSRRGLSVQRLALVGQLAGSEPRRVVVAEHAPAERALASQHGPRLGLHRRRLVQARLSRAWYRRGLDLDDRVLLHRRGLRHAQPAAPAVQPQRMGAAEMR